MTAWPSAGGALPPVGDLDAAAVWLVARHPSLAALVDRVPGAVVVDEEGPRLWLDVLSDALHEHTRVLLERREYERQHRPPADDDLVEAWRAGFPQFGPRGAAVAQMTASEQLHLRLLASLGDKGTLIRARDFARLDDAGREFLQDWMDAVTPTAAAERPAERGA